MVRKFQINLSNKTFYTLATIGIFVLASVVVYAYTGIPNSAWHGADTVVVTVSGAEKTLQTAINDGSLGGGCPTGYAWAYIGDQAICTVSNWEMDCNCYQAASGGHNVDATFKARFNAGKYESKIDKCIRVYDTFNCNTDWSQSPGSCGGVCTVSLNLVNRVWTLSGSSSFGDSDGYSCTCTKPYGGTETSSCVWVTIPVEAYTD